MAVKPVQTRQSSGGTPADAHKYAKIAAEIRDDLGFQPEPAEVAELIRQAINADLVPHEHRAEAATIAAGLLDPTSLKEWDAAPLAYANLLAWLRSGASGKIIAEFLGEIYQKGDVLEFFTLNGPATAHATMHYRHGVDDVSRAAWINQFFGTRNIYFGINPRLDDRAGKAKASSDEHVKLRRHVVLDFDNKDAPETEDHPDWSRTLAALGGLEPFAVINSGNGWHVWFRIEEITGQDVQTCNGLLDRGMAAVGADAIADARRIIRLPGTINIPGKAKRNRAKKPSKLAIARLVQPVNRNAKVWHAADLAAALQGVAHDLGLPGRASKAGGGSSARSAVIDPAKLNAPDFPILQRTLALLPNGTSLSHSDRNQYQVPIAHAVRGSALGTTFEQEARDAFLEWCGKFGGDPIHDAKLYDGASNTHTGFDRLLSILRSENPQGYAEVEQLLAEHQKRRAQLAFAGAELDPDQAHLLDPTVETGGLEPDSTVDPNTAGGGFGKAGGNGRENAAEKALNLLKDSGAEIFPDHKGGTWIKLAGAVRCVDSDTNEGFRGVLGWLAKERGTRLLGTQANNLKELIQSEVHGQKAREVHYRVLQGKDTVRINLMRPTADMVIVTAVGWHLQPVSTAPEPMANRIGALPLPMPERVTDGIGFFERLGRHIRLDAIQRPNDPYDTGVQQRAILLAFLLSQFWRPGAVPHLLLTAEQGAGKTTTARRLKALTDPDTADVVQSLPNDEKDLYAIAGQQTSLVIDNASRIKAEHSDLFCALATGAAFQKRALYKDGERTIFEAKTSVVFTSILDDLVKRDDLMERTFPLALPPLGDKDRRPETELDAAWNADHGLLLGGLLDLLAGGLAHLPKLDTQRVAGLIPHPPRMADAANIAEAAAQATGWQAGVCTAALAAVKRGASSDLLEDNPVAFRLREFLAQQPNGSWTGNATELKRALEFLGGPEWGRSGTTIQAFTSLLTRAVKNLRENWGVDVQNKRTNGRRSLAIQQLVKGERDA